MLTVRSSSMHMAQHSLSSPQLFLYSLEDLVNFWDITSKLSTDF